VGPVYARTRSQAQRIVDLLLALLVREGASLLLCLDEEWRRFGTLPIMPSGESVVRSRRRGGCDDDDTHANEEVERMS
jgi:hypothetical protein